MAECDSFSVLDAVDAVAGYKRIHPLLWQGLLEEHQLQCQSLRLLQFGGEVEAGSKEADVDVWNTLVDLRRSDASHMSGIPSA
jgi:hypothetical protein